VVLIIGKVMESIDRAGSARYELANSGYVDSLRLRHRRLGVGGGHEGNSVECRSDWQCKGCGRGVTKTQVDQVERMR